MPLIVMLMLICVIAITLLVGAPFGRPAETAELNKDVEQEEEQISAETTNVSAGQTYIVPKDGVYKIELHGGKSADVVWYSYGPISSVISGNRGSKVTAYINLKQGERLITEELLGGDGLSYRLAANDQIETITPDLFAGARGIRLRRSFDRKNTRSEYWW